MNDAIEVTLRQRAYATIQSKLLGGEIRAGDLVSELALAHELGMSRTPVREAIGQLEFEGVFEKVPRVGTLVCHLEARELSELYEVREALESHAAAVAAPLLRASDWEQLAGAHRELDELLAQMKQRRLQVLDEALLRRFFRCDIAFHGVIVGANANRRAQQIISEFRVRQRIFEYDRMNYSREVIASAWREHGAILRALQCGEAEAARLAMGDHIRSACQHALQHFAAPSTKANSSQRRQRPRRKTAPLMMAP